MGLRQVDKRQYILDLEFDRGQDTLFVIISELL